MLLWFSLLLRSLLLRLVMVERREHISAPSE